MKQGRACHKGRLAVDGRRRQHSFHGRTVFTNLRATTVTVGRNRTISGRTGMAKCTSLHQG